MKKVFQILILVALTLASLNIVSFNNSLVEETKKFKNYHNSKHEQELKNLRIAYVDILNPLPAGSFFCLWVLVVILMKLEHEDIFQLVLKIYVKNK